MTKQEFITALRDRLSGLPLCDINERLTFYSEMIDDRIEEGLSEEGAISDIGSVDEIAAQITSDIPLSRLIKERMKPQRRLSASVIVLLAIGSPLWLSLFIAAIAIGISFYAVIWALIITLWAVFASVATCSMGGTVAGILFTVRGQWSSGLAIIGASVFCIGLAIFLLFGCKNSTKGTILLTKKLTVAIKKCFVRKEKAK